MNKFLKWWLIFCLSLLFAYIGYYLGFMDEVYAKDSTKLSFVIMALYLAGSVMIGTATYHKSKGKQVSARIDTGWFMAESMLALGMIGTVAGFILMLGSSFETIDVSNQSSLKEALTAMALGMSTALYTTLVGLICSQLFKVQLVNIEITE
jgi:hypothetical protein